jgi:hypothetical protein
MASYAPLPPGCVAFTMGKKDRMEWGIQTGPTSKSLVNSIRLPFAAVKENIQKFGKIGPFGQAMDELKVSGPGSPGRCGASNCCAVVRWRVRRRAHGQGGGVLEPGVGDCLLEQG